MLVILTNAETKEEVKRINLPMPPEAPDTLNINGVVFFACERTFHISGDCEIYAEVQIARL